MINDLNSI